MLHEGGEGEDNARPLLSLGSPQVIPSEGDFWVRRINLLPGPNFLSVESTGPRFVGQPSDGRLEPATVLQAARRPVDLAMEVIP